VLRITFTDPGSVPDYLKIQPVVDKIITRNSLELKPIQHDASKCLTPGLGHRSLFKDIQINLKRNPVLGSSRGKKQGLDFKSIKSIKTETEKEGHMFEKSNSASAREYGHPSHPSEIIDTQIEAGVAKVQVPQFKVCIQCSSRRPPRAKHCIECGQCILRRDRHCYLLGSCIGFYNHKFFILALLYSVVILGIVLNDVTEYLIQHLNEVTLI
jgi:ribosomal protein L40E